jgi:hypothetical protein
MSTWNKTAGTSVLTLQSIASNTVVISSAVDVSTKFAAFLGIHFGRRTTSALTAGARFRVEGSMKSSGDGFWFSLAEFLTAIAAAESEAVSGTVSAGTNVITVASTTNLTVGDLVYLDNSTIGNSEWGRVKAVSANVSITIEDNLLNAQTGSTIFDNGEFFSVSLDLSAVTRLRLVADFSGTGQACSAEAFLVTGDSIA